MKYVVIIQCEISMKRCSGYNCTKAFYNKTGKFEDYPETEYLSLSCGGCNGKGISARLQHLDKVLTRDKINKDDVAVHFSTCISHDNTHHDRCPNINVMRKIILKRGFVNIVEGTEINTLSEQRRKDGLYKVYK
jgi:predicted metal-binding protein